jgi:AcrR family transcriptional regulator
MSAWYTYGVSLSSKDYRMSTRRQPGSEPRAPLNRDRVLRAAISLADDEGIDALTMRRLGERLGVEAMSLYNHVANKEDLLVGMGDIILGEIELPAEDVDWKTAMRCRAVSARDVFVSHPWAVVLVDTRAHPGPAALRYADSVLGSLRRGGFTPNMAARAFWVLDSYIYGSARQQSNVQLQEEADPTSAQATRELPPETYPYLVEAALSYASEPGWDTEDEFEFGLEMILEGLERHMAAR